jgi:nicotinic acid mononucleotide adenylyltransferase
VRLRGELAAQLTAAQQRVVELTLATEEAANLRAREAEARRVDDEASKKVLALLERACKEDGEATRI